jgi:hypothetical protein
MYQGRRIRDRLSLVRFTRFWQIRASRALSKHGTIVRLTSIIGGDADARVAKSMPQCIGQRRNAAARRRNADSST